MEKREDRRDRTIRYGASARRVHLRSVHPNGPVDCVCELSVWFFAKRKSVGCRCRRRGHRGGPKVVQSFCHGSYSGGYHPSTRERIDGNRLCRRWLVELRAKEADDVDL